MIAGYTLAVLAQTGPSMAIPGPYWLFTILHWLTLALHLLAMNFLFGGILLMIFAKKSPYRKLLFFENIKAFPSAMSATVTLGVAPLLFLQVIFGKYFYSASIVSGWNWFLIVPVAIVVYYLLYGASLKKNLSDASRVKLLILAAIGMVYISYTLTMISDLTVKPYLWTGLYASSPSGWSFNPSWGQTIIRWLHILAGSIAVVGVIIQLYTIYFKKVKGNRELLKFGGRMYLFGVVIAPLLAIAYLFTLEPTVIKEFLHSPGLHTLITAIIVNAIVVILVYKSISASEPKPLVLSSTALTFVGIFLMVMTRHFLRLTYLKGDFDPSALNIHTQAGSMSMFLICFVIGLGVLYWMLKQFFTATSKT